MTAVKPTAATLQRTFKRVHARWLCALSGGDSAALARAHAALVIARLAAGASLLVRPMRQDPSDLKFEAQRWAAKCWRDAKQKTSGPRGRSRKRARVEVPAGEVDRLVLRGVRELQRRGVVLTSQGGLAYHLIRSGLGGAARPTQIATAIARLRRAKRLVSMRRRISKATSPHMLVIRTDIRLAPTSRKKAKTRERRRSQ